MKPSAESIDLIYEASVLPELWPSVIEHIAAETDAFGGSLFTADDAHSVAIASQNCVEHLDALLSGHWSQINIRAQRLVAAADVGFVCDEDLASPEEIKNHPIYRDFLRPRGLGWVAGTYIMGAASDIAIFSIDRRHSQGPFDRKAIAFLNELRPHISRSIILSRSFADAEAKGALRGLESVGVPAAGIDERGRVKIMNQPFSRLKSQITAGPSDVIRAEDAAANSLLRKFLSEPSSQYAQPMSIGVKGDSDAAPFVLHLTPLRGEARGVFSSVAFILSVVPLTQPGLPFRSLVHRLYDFTPTEARVAESLIAGRSAKQIAIAFGIAVDTVRSHIKSILLKTGVSRQMEFLARFSAFASS